MKKVIAVLLLSLLATSLFAVSYEARYGICYGQKYEYNYPFTQYSHDWDVKQGLYQNVGLDAFLGKGFLQIGASADAGFLYAWHKQHLTNNGVSLVSEESCTYFGPLIAAGPSLRMNIWALNFTLGLHASNMGQLYSMRCGAKIGKVNVNAVLSISTTQVREDLGYGRSNQETMPSFTVFGLSGAYCF